MRIQNTRHQYGIMSKCLHWLIAVAIFGMLGLGFVAKNISNKAVIGQRSGSTNPLGYHCLPPCCCVLCGVSSIYRSQVRTPSWQIIAAKSVHWCFYISIITTIIIGWLVSSTGKHGVFLWGWFDATLPTGRNRTLHHLTTWHYWLAWLIVGLIVTHIAAALKHWLINRDRIMQRMLLD